MSTRPFWSTIFQTWTGSRWSPFSKSQPLDFSTACRNTLSWWERSLTSHSTQGRSWARETITLTGMIKLIKAGKSWRNPRSSHLGLMSSQHLQILFLASFICFMMIQILKKCCLELEFTKMNTTNLMSLKLWERQSRKLLTRRWTKSTHFQMEFQNFGKPL